MSKTWLLVGLVLVVSAMAPLSEASAVEPARNVRADESARAVVTVTAFFEALEAHQYRRACSLLGVELRAESGGARCPAFLRAGALEPLRWEIRGIRVGRDGIGVLVRLGQSELDHVRMRTWLAIVRLEGGVARIVETRLLH